MDARETHKYGTLLKSSLPLAGRLIRRVACRKLAENPSAEAIPYLIEALSSCDEEVRDVSLAALDHIRDQGAIDALCSLWIEKRDKFTEEIIIRNKYVARTPLAARVYSALLVNATEISVENRDNLFLVLSALEDRNKTLASAARNALDHIENQKAIDALCSLWFDERDKLLEEILTRNKYLARAPLPVRVYSALKTGSPEIAVESGENLPYVISALVDDDPSIAIAAREAMNHISGAGAINSLCSFLKDKNPSLASFAKEALHRLSDAEAIDALCEYFIRNPSDDLLSIIRDKDYHPKDIGRRCVLYILTQQFERYLELDFDAQYLRTEYHRSDERLRRRIADAIRKTSDPRLLSLFRPSTKRKPASELNEEEARLVIDVNARNEKWANIFAFLFHVSLVNSVYALDILRNAGWRPDDAISAALFDELIEARSGVNDAPPKPAAPGASFKGVIMEWIRKGQEEFSRFSDDDLRELIHNAPPAEAVMALSAISQRGKAGSGVVETARSHKVWLARLACLLLCDIAPQFAFSDVPLSLNGGESWIKRAAPFLLDSLIYRKRPIQLSPLQLKTLQGVLSGKKKTGLCAWGALYEIIARRHLRHVIEIDEKMAITITCAAIEIEA